MRFVKLKTLNRYINTKFTFKNIDEVANLN